MFSRLISTLLFLPFLLIALPACAHNPTEEASQNRVTFQIEVVREIQNDRALARLSIVEEGKESSAVANAVNKRMSAALAQAKRVKGVDVESGTYMTNPIHRDGRIIRWRAQQELRLESSDVDALSSLLGKLQGKSVLLSGISFFVSAETRKALEDEMIEEGLQAFRARASLVAKGMGTKDWSLIRLSVNGVGTPSIRRNVYARSDMMMSAEAAPPSFEAGASEIRVRIDGTVELD